MLELNSVTQNAPNYLHPLLVYLRLSGKYFLSFHEPHHQPTKLPFALINFHNNPKDWLAISKPSFLCSKTEQNKAALLGSPCFSPESIPIGESNLELTLT